MAATRPKITLARTYEDFQPHSKLIQEEDCETLTMELPEFKKEQIRAQMDDREGTLYISGEQPIANNKWSRFRKELRVPVNCNKSEIQAKFENGLLRIIMPLKVFPIVQRIPDQKPIPVPPPPPPPPRQSQNPVTTEPKPTFPPVIEPNPISSPRFPPRKKPVTESEPIPTSPPPPSQKSNTEPKITPTLEPLPTENSSYVRPSYVRRRVEPTMRPPSPPPSSQKSNTEPKLTPTLEPPPTDENSSYVRTLAPMHRPSHSDPPNIQHRRPPLRTKPVPQHPLSKEIVPESNPTTVPHNPLSHTQATDTNQPATLKSKMSEILGIKSKSEIGEDDSKVEKHLDLKTGELKDGEKQEKAKLVKSEIKKNASHSGVKVAMEWDESKQYIINMIAAVVVIIALWIYTKYTVKTPW